MRRLPASALAMAGAMAMAALTFGATEAKAQLAAPTSEAQCIDNVTGDVIGATSCDNGGAHVQITLNGAPTVQAVGSNNDGATGNLTYNFQVIGGTTGAPVTVDVTSLLQWTVGSPTGSAFSRIIFDFGGFETQKFICTPGGCSGTGAGVDFFYGTLSLNGVSGGIGAIEIDASAGDLPGRGESHAIADPFISIDNATPDADRYSIVLSDGVGNAVTTPSGAPEPAAWALMLLGFGLGGTALRARRWRPSPAAAAG
jgi:hypothetical protein